METGVPTKRLTIELIFGHFLGNDMDYWRVPGWQQGRRIPSVERNLSEDCGWEETLLMENLVDWVLAGSFPKWEHTLATLLRRIMYQYLIYMRGSLVLWIILRAPCITFYPNRLIIQTNFAVNVITGYQTRMSLLQLSSQEITNKTKLLLQGHLVFKNGSSPVLRVTFLWPCTRPL